ncbi:diguanylate cyclase [Pseudomonas sp. ZM24]|uniref:sensor domain-containing diguanylate cyclase n=1 Tax=Pseudomonas triclosanedens TaxID=2961893 RepID=UPI0020C403CB|nr:sensor domain-containing diguanylate cyclase [Pseudomonas triclosanedens]MCP8478423.1 diguanylate cyclase [Pseudomonas triclosanedens]
MQTSSDPDVQECGRYDSLLRLVRHPLGAAAALLVDLHGRLLGFDGLPRETAQSLATLISLHAAEAPLRCNAGNLHPLASVALQAIDGSCLGWLSLFDYQPRTLDAAGQSTLQDAVRVARALLDRPEERRLALAITGSGTGVWDRHVPSGRIHYSPGWKALLGYADNEIGNRIEDAYTRVHPDDLDYVRKTISDHFEGRTTAYEVEHRLRHKGGHYIWVCSRGRVIERDDAGCPLRMIGTTTDITALRGVSEQLRQNVELLTDLTNEIPGMVFQFRRLPDGTGTFPYVSVGVLDIYGVTAEEIRNDSAALLQLIHPDDKAAFVASLEASASTLRPWRHEFRMQLPGRGVLWRQGNAQPKRLSDGSVIWHGFITDITERKRIEAELQVLATTDFLTQLPNRRHFMQLIEAELARVQRSVERSAAILMCDLDHFKAINDRWGHAVGDEALRHFTGILGHAIRRIDFAGRMGGEEFAVVLSDADVASAVSFARRLQQKLAELPLLQGCERIPLSISIGIATLDATDSSVEAALSRSDSALYRAKQNGRNRIECY